MLHLKRHINKPKIYLLFQYISNDFRSEEFLNSTMNVHISPIFNYSFSIPSFCQCNVLSFNLNRRKYISSARLGNICKKFILNILQLEFSGIVLLTKCFLIHAQNLVLIWKHGHARRFQTNDLLSNVVWRI